MLLLKPKQLQVDTQYVMKISNILIKRKEKSNLRDILIFVIHVWPDNSKPDEYYEIKEKFFDGGDAEKYLSKFIEVTTGETYGEIAYVDMIGAVFRGYIAKKVHYDQYGAVTFLNIVPIEHIAFVEE